VKPVIGIAGGSASGKTTLAQALAHLVWTEAA
jgi:uridine kinase